MNIEMTVISTNIAADLLESPSVTTLADYAATALGEWAELYDVDGLTADFRDEIASILPPAWMIFGEELHAPAGTSADAIDGDLQERAQMCDFWAIAADHDKGYTVTYS